MRIRRIFRRAPTDPRRWGPFAVGLGAAAGIALLAVGLPSQLFGSAPPESSWTAAAGDIRVLDGDTLRFGGRLLRLHGVAVPQRGRATCPGPQEQSRDCAGAAATALVRLVADRVVECRIQRRDGEGRALGVCHARMAARGVVPDVQTRNGVAQSGASQNGASQSGASQDGVELNASLVAAGWAMVEPGAGPALALLEAAARREGRGLWATDATPPDAWRRRF